MIKYRLGKRPARHDPRVPTIHRLLGGAKLPLAKPISQWSKKVPRYGMLLNDQMGDCVVASGLHQVQTWSANANTEIVPDDGSVLADYSTLTGYNPATGANDTGLNVDDFLQYWMVTGLRVREGGEVHKLDGYARLDPHDLHTLRACIYWFGGVATGVMLPGDAEDAFDAGQPWTATDADPVGGHGICLVDCDDEYLYAITWGKVQPLSYKWWLTYADEADALISMEWLKSNFTPSGLDLAQMQCEITALQGRLAA